MKICKDGRIWGQTNKEAGSHLGILTGRKKRKYIKKGQPKTHWWRTGGEFIGGIPWNKGIKRTDILGEKHPNWKGGISKTKEWRLERNRIWRKNHPKYIRLKSKLRKYRVRCAEGVITKEILQRVYEDNIKKFGTLTCYLCLIPIRFGNDNLEHKIPISKGGTNHYENLGVACKKCNCSKKDMTIEEFLTKGKVGDGKCQIK